MADLSGETLGQYLLLEQIGKGGMATVYKAHQASLGRNVAVKVLHPSVAGEEEFVNRFRQEARAVATLRNVHIVQVHDFGIEDRLYYMVMEYIEGVTLKARLQELKEAGQLMPLEEVCRLIGQVSEALDYAHSRGMIHRDVKPSNILLTLEDDAVLSDFGLAKMVEGTSLTKTGITGTPEYMSPEQAEGREMDARTDIYSLGIVLYEMLTGQAPFSADTPLAVLIKHIQAPLPLPRRANPDVPPAVERVVLKVMAKNPKTRYARAGQMAQALSRALEASPPVRPSPAPSKPRLVPKPGQASSSSPRATPSQAMKERKCPNCGHINAIKKKFCTNCGTPLKTDSLPPSVLRCPRCGRLNQKTRKFCTNCGLPLPAGPRQMTCPRCGEANAPGYRFCKRCGTTLR
jgi:serine/threonine protein kinase